MFGKLFIFARLLYTTWYIHIHICMLHILDMCASVCKCVYIYIYIHLYMYMCVCMYVYVYVCLYMFMCLCACVFIFMYLHTFVYIYMYIWRKGEKQNHPKFECPLSWGYRIHWLHLCRRVRLPHQRYDTKQSSLPLFPGSLWPEVVAPDRVLSMGQIELNCVFMLNWIVWNRTVFDFETVFTLNWIVWYRTVYLYKNGFGIK